MESETTQVQGHKSSWNTVTPLSKYLAMALFVALPFIGGWVGYMYAPEKVVEVERIVTVNDALNSDTEKDIPSMSVSHGEWSETNQLHSLQYSYPVSFDHYCGDTDVGTSCIMTEKIETESEHSRRLTLRYPSSACKNDSPCVDFEDRAITIKEDHLSNGIEGDQMYQEFRNRYHLSPNYKYVEDFSIEGNPIPASIYAVDRANPGDSPFVRYRALIQNGEDFFMADIDDAYGLIFLKDFLSRIRPM